MLDQGLLRGSSSLSVTMDTGFETFDQITNFVALMWA